MENMEEKFEDDNCKIFFNTYKSPQFYYIPETAFDMRGDGGTNIIIQTNVNLIDEVEIYGAELTVFEKKNKNMPAYIVMLLDDDFLIIELS